VPVGASLAVLGIQAHQEDAQDDQFEHRPGTAGEDPDDQTQDDRNEIIDAPQQDQRWIVDSQRASPGLEATGVLRPSKEPVSWMRYRMGIVGGGYRGTSPISSPSCLMPAATCRAWPELCSRPDQLTGGVQWET
jgi:hypothetical protein